MRAARDRVAYNVIMRTIPDADDPARAALLFALGDGRAYTPRELASATRMSTAEARGHLQSLEQDHVVTMRRQGPHGYFQLSGGNGEKAAADRHIAPAHIRTGPKDPAMRAARVCYGHLAGPRAVRLFDGLTKRGLIAADGEALRLTDSGETFLSDFGIDLAALRGVRKPLCKICLDWTERRSHMAGPLGSALLNQITALGWATRDPGSRLITFSKSGEAAFDALLAA